MPPSPEVVMRKSSLAVLAVFLVLLGVLLPVLLPRPSKVTRAAFERIEVGMNQKEVEAVLGGPPGDYRNAPIPASIIVRDELSGIEEPARLESIEPVPIHPGKTEMW